MKRRGWDWFPIGIFLSMSVVVAVNAGFIWSALASFPGEANEHSFDTGNDYNRVLDEAARQAALGWQMAASIESGHVVVRLTDRQGALLPNLDLHAEAQHPLGPAQLTRIDFSLSGDHYVATSALPSTGQWDIAVAAAVSGASYHATRRVIIQ